MLELERKVQLRTQELVELSEKLIKEIENSALTETTLEYHKNYDPLTGLPNRITLINTLSSMLEKGKPKDKVSVLYLGLRNFKSINDFLNRVNPKDMNKLQLEGLVKAGALDSINKNRQSLFDSIPNFILKTKNYI